MNAQQRQQQARAPVVALLAIVDLVAVAFAAAAVLECIP